MGLTDQEMERLLRSSLLDADSSPVEREVYAVIGGYKLALIRTNHMGVWHRFMCWTGDKDALALEAALARAKQHAKEVLGQSPEHRLALKQAVRSQPSDIGQKDNLLSLLSGSTEA